MPGMQNIWRNGLYQGPHKIRRGIFIQTAQAGANQTACSGPLGVFLECSPMDTTATPHIKTFSQPSGRVLTGVTNGIGKAVLNSSQILFVNGACANQSGTLKSLHAGNCKLSQMIQPSALNAPFEVNG